MWLCYHVQHPCGFVTMYTTHVAILPCTAPMWLFYHVPMWLCHLNNATMYPSGCATTYSTHEAMLPCTAPMWLCHVISTSAVCIMPWLPWHMPDWFPTSLALQQDCFMSPCDCRFLQPAITHWCSCGPLMSCRTHVAMQASNMQKRMMPRARGSGLARAACVNMQHTARATDSGRQALSVLPPSHIHNLLHHLSASRPQGSTPNWHAPNCRSPSPTCSLRSQPSPLTPFL
jgi:hypothetical protein